MSLLQRVCRMIQINPNAVPSRQIARYVWPTLRELKRRKDRMAPEGPINRTTFLEWNYGAELFAFGQRVNEKFDTNLLQQAFVHRSYIIQEELKQQQVGIEQPETNLHDNQELADIGEKLISNYVDVFVAVQLSSFPMDGVRAIRNYLMSNDVLADVSKHLGTTELILSQEFPVEQETLVKTIKAVIGALCESSGPERAYDFIRDFICTQLNQKDINELWPIDNPKEMLNEICESRKLGTPEPRLLGTAGRNTILATYNIGIYCNKKLLGTGFGEAADIAYEVAARNSLQKIFGTENHKPFDYRIDSTELFKLYDSMVKRTNSSSSVL